MAYLRIAVWLAAAGLLAWAGWTVAVWRDKAARSDNLAVLYHEALKARVDADARTRHAEMERDAARAHATELETQNREAKVHETVRTIVKKVVEKVPASAECDLNADVVELLNNARGAAGAVSKATTDTTDPATRPAAPADPSAP